MSSSRFLRKKHPIHLPRKFLTFSCFLVPFRGLQSDPRVHRWVHLPLDEKQGEQPAAQPRALPQAHWGMGLSSHHQLELLDQLFHRLTGGWTRTLSS